MESGGEFLDVREVAKAIGLQEDTFRSLVEKGFLPRALAFSARLRSWSREDVSGMIWMLKNISRFKSMTPEEAAKEEAAERK